MQSSTAASEVLSRKIDNALSAYPTEPYQIALGNGALKQLLLNYVECKLKQAIPSLNEPENWNRLPQQLQQLVDLELRLESYIYWGIEYIIQNQLDLGLSSKTSKQGSCSVQDMAQTCMPVYWFG